MTYHAIASIASAAAVAATVQPNPIYQAASYMKLESSTTNGKLYNVDYVTPDVATNQSLRLLHVYGTPYEMGEANGLLMGPRILDFINNGLAEYYNEQIGNVPFFGKLPEWLQKIIIPALENDAVGAMNQALQWVFDAEKPFIDADPMHFEDEVSGMAHGVCNASLAMGVPCSVANLTSQLRYINMLPELIKMSCSMMGAWGQATIDGPMQGKLIQMRTLDFGGGPFADASIITVYHPTSGYGNPWANVAFPGMIGSITGMSSKVALSEKIWLVSGQPTQKGDYHGKPDILAIRDMLQFANTKEDAVAQALANNRTWAVFLGVGDYASQQMDVLAYRMEDVHVLTDLNATLFTNQTVIKDLVYVDKHTQPDGGNQELTKALQALYGNMTAASVASNIPRITQSGDVHVAVYDFKNSQMYVSLGHTLPDGSFGPNNEGMACNRPYFQFDMQALFNVPQ